jgi:vancomycin permeability regulator SanA
VLLTSNAWVLARARRHLFALGDVPARPWAIVLGARVYPSGRPCALLEDRLAAAAALLEAGVVERALMSGAPDEVEAMRAYVLELVDAEVALDPGGVRTFETCRRAREVLGIDAAVMVTNPFHLARTVYLARVHGIDAVGAKAPAVSGASPRSLARSRAREVFSRARAVFDVVR